MVFSAKNHRKWFVSPTGEQCYLNCQKGIKKRPNHQLNGLTLEIVYYLIILFGAALITRMTTIALKIKLGSM
jgi:hypothetical protein